MDDAAISQVRRFNRVVTQRIGALDDRFLSRDRSLGEARLLWEVGPQGGDLRALRSRLGLDAGYLSRMLRSLERAGLVRVAPNPADRRVRIARLTAAGLAERVELDRRSDQLAASELGHGSPRRTGPQADGDCDVDDGGDRGSAARAPGSASSLATAKMKWA